MQRLVSMVPEGSFMSATASFSDVLEIDTVLLFSSTSTLFPSTTCDPSDMTSDQCAPDETYEWEALGIHGARLDQKLVSPAVQCLEALRVVDVVDQDTAVCSPVKGDTKRLKSLLTSSVPQLCAVSFLSSFQ